MPLPLYWLGAAALTAIVAKSASDDRKNQQKQRGHSYKPRTLSDIGRHDSPVAIYPSELFDTEQTAKPEVGAIVCCGIGGVLDHTGIWVDDDTIIEMDGNGLIKPVSVARFTKERSGENIYIACDSTAKPLADVNAARRACEQVYQMQNYHVIDNNCHQFIWQCFKPNDKELTTFKLLNVRLAQYFNREVYWDLCLT